MFKFFKIVFLFFYFLALTISQVFAHGGEKFIYVKINGEDTVINPIEDLGITASTFLIPKDLAPKNYLVNQNINFEIDKDKLGTGISDDILKTTKIDWDYGDNTQFSGLKNTHAYKKIGSYILTTTLNVYTKDNPTPTKYTNSLLVNIIPNNDFTDLPKAVIKIDGKKVENPLKQTLEFSMNKSLTFDASESHESSAGIIEYLWNFGDGQTSPKKVDTYKYVSGDFKTVVLQVKDKNGFSSDAYVRLTNVERAQSTNSSKSKIELGIIIAIFLAILLIILSLKKKKLS